MLARDWSILYSPTHKVHFTADLRSKLELAPTALFVDIIAAVLAVKLDHEPMCNEATGSNAANQRRMRDNS
jgi:hypothetical protein